MNTPRSIKPPPVRAITKTDETPAPTPKLEGAAPASAPSAGGLTPEEIAAALDELSPDDGDDEGVDEEEALAAALAATKAPKARAAEEMARQQRARLDAGFADVTITTHTGYEVTDNVDAKSAMRLIISAMRTPGVEHFQDKSGCVVIITPRAVLRIRDEAAIETYLKQASVQRIPGLSAPV